MKFDPAEILGTRLPHQAIHSPRLPHSVDSRFGLHHVAVVLSFLRSLISLAEIWVIKAAFSFLFITDT